MECKKRVERSEREDTCSGFLTVLRRGGTTSDILKVTTRVFSIRSALPIHARDTERMASVWIPCRCSTGVGAHAYSSSAEVRSTTSTEIELLSHLWGEKAKTVSKCCRFSDGGRERKEQGGRVIKMWGRFILPSKTDWSELREVGWGVCVWRGMVGAGGWKGVPFVRHLQWVIN